MADQTQQGGGILDSLESGLGRVLPYAIPIGLGAAMGAPVGMGLAGAAAGLGEAEGQAGERQQRQQELAMKQKELAMEAQEWDLKKQQGQLALQNAQATEDFAKSIKDPEQQARFRTNPSAFFEYGDWAHYTNALRGDPGFASAQGISPELARALPDMPPAIGKSMIEATAKANAKGEFPNQRVITNADGTTTLLGVRRDGSTKVLAMGASNAKVAADLKKDKAENPADVKKVGPVFVRTNPPPGGLSRLAGATGMAGETLEQWRDRGAAALEAQGVDPEVAANFMATQGAGGTAKPDTNAKMKAPAAPPTAPKELWGKTVTVNGKRYKIDSKGNATPL